MTVDVNTIALLLIAFFQCVAAVLSFFTHRAAIQTEKNTNSMKDALVKATREAAHAAGFEEARKEGIKEKQDATESR